VRFGLKFPTREVGSDPGAVRTWAQTAEGLGFDHVVMIEHVLGVDPLSRPDFGDLFPAESKRPPYVAGDEFHEPMVMMGFLAACTTTIELATGVLVLPQRQTALAAKQLAEVDLLSRGRTRLCVGVGWNPIEYEALGMDFSTRGARIEEQAELLRALWTEPVVSFDGRFDKVLGAGIAPRPVQQPIPIWFGGWAEPALRRAGRIGDGWYCAVDPSEAVLDAVLTVRCAAQQSGRDGAAIGIEGGIELRNGLDVEERIAAWESVGATHLSIDPMNCGLSPFEHVDMLDKLAKMLPLSDARV
jgi:probable F420-dependent oxidoreductase